MGSPAAVRRAGAEIVRLGAAGLDPFAFRSAVISRVASLVPHDTYWFPTVDPATLLVTGALLKNIPEWAAPHFFENEFLRDDYNKFTELVAGPARVQTLFEATEGDLARSERYRGLLADLGYGDDLRVALMEGDACWGYMCFHRERGSAGFTPDDTAVLRPLVTHIAAGLRTSILQAVAGASSDACDEPGLVVLAPDLSFAAVNSAAERWFDELGAGPANGFPDAIFAAAWRLRAIERSPEPQTLPPPVARARTRRGRWLTLHASRLSGPGTDGLTAVIVEPSAPIEIAPLIAKAYGLSRRESEVAMQVLHGLSTKEISRRLQITQNTVQDHLKSIFDKVGVRSRRELTAQLAVRHYAPQRAFQRYRSSPAEQQAHDWFYDDLDPS